MPKLDLSKTFIFLNIGEKKKIILQIFYMNLNLITIKRDIMMILNIMAEINENIGLNMMV